VEGVDTYNACYGGTAAMLNCMNWVQSYSHDGRFALAMSTDIADAPAGYRFMCGAASIAMLVGVDAPMRMNRERQTHIIHRWDFYKPIGWPTMAPIVDGPGSIDVYYECLDACQFGLAGKSGLYNIVDESEFLIFHLGSGPKFVKHAFERACANAWGFTPPKSGLTRLKKYDGFVPIDRITRAFNKKTAPSLRLATRIGPMHTAATYVNTNSLLIHENTNLIGKTVNFYSYGSGAASTMFRFTFDALPGYVEEMHKRLDERDFHPPATFDAIEERYSNTYAKFDWVAKVDTKQPGGAFYLRECDAIGRRTYFQVVDPVYKLSGPILNEPPPRTAEQKARDAEAMKPRPPYVDPEEEAEKAKAAAAAAAPPPAAAAGGQDVNQLAGLLQLLAQAQK